MLKFMKATTAHLNRLDQLYKTCIQDLNTKGIFQWDERYPNMETYKSSVETHCHFLVMDGETFVGALILNEIQSIEWQVIPWNQKLKKALVIHALAIHPSEQGKGYGQKILDMCHQYGIENGYEMMRLDVFSENLAALHLYEKNGYQKVGAVTFASKPVDHQTYYCYDRELI